MARWNEMKIGRIVMMVLGNVRFIDVEDVASYFMV